RAFIKAARAEVSSPFKRATTPTQKSRPSEETLTTNAFFWESAAAKLPAASQSRSYKARVQRELTIIGSFSDPGSLVRIFAIAARKGRVSARRASSTKARQIHPGLPTG